MRRVRSHKTILLIDRILLAEAVIMPPIVYFIVVKMIGIDWPISVAIAAMIMAGFVLVRYIMRKQWIAQGLPEDTTHKQSSNSSISR